MTTSQKPSENSLYFMLSVAETTDFDVSDCGRVYLRRHYTDFSHRIRLRYPKKVADILIREAQKLSDRQDSSTVLLVRPKKFRRDLLVGAVFREMFRMMAQYLVTRGQAQYVLCASLAPADADAFWLPTLAQFKTYWMVTFHERYIRSQKFRPEEIHRASETFLEAFETTCRRTLSQSVAA